jgi:flagellar biogenesis protein FliO
VTLALLLIVGLIALLAWGASACAASASAPGRIQVLSDRAVGPKERCVLVRVGDTDILSAWHADASTRCTYFPRARSP